MADTVTSPLPKTAAPRQSTMIGIALMCAALFCFSCLDATAKWVNRSVDPMVTVWARYMAAALLTFMVINPRTKPGVLKTRRLPLQLLRSLLLFASTICNFFALKYLQLVETQSIIFATPLLVALFAGPLLGEHIGWRRMAAVAVGFAGVLVITRPGSGTMHPAALLSVASTVAYAFYNIVTRMLASSDPVATTTVYSSVAGIAIVTPVLPWIWTTPPSPLTWFLLATTGLLRRLRALASDSTPMPGRRRRSCRRSSTARSSGCWCWAMSCSATGRTLGPSSGLASSSPRGSICSTVNA